MSTGTIKWFNPTKGFGFIDTGEEGKDIFLHVSALQESGIDQITEGDSISYDVGENRGKPTAINIKKL